MTSPTNSRRDSASLQDRPHSPTPQPGNGNAESFQSVEPSVALDDDGSGGSGRSLRFAYADPPYPRCAKAHYSKDPSGIVAEEVDHKALIERLMTFDAWALSTHTPALRDILPLCPPKARVGAWVKTFASFKRGVRVAYSWEPVIFCGERKQSGQHEITIHDWVSAMPPIFTKRNLDGTKGQKPIEFCFWLFALMGLRPTDEMHDLFPGSGAVQTFWKSYCVQSVFSLGGGGAEHGEMCFDDDRKTTAADDAPKRGAEEFGSASAIGAGSADRHLTHDRKETE